MLRLFCRCGYPLWLAARWTGDEIIFVLYDGQGPPNRDRPLITCCPKCGEVLATADLAEQNDPIWLKQLDRYRSNERDRTAALAGIPG